MAGSGVPLLSESLIYDHRGKVVREIGSSTDMAYTGLGHLKRMSHSPGIVSRYTVETFEPNGLGLVLRDSTRVDVASDGTPGGSGYPDITAHNASYGPGGRLAGKLAEWTPVTEEEDDSIAPGTWTGLKFSRNYDAATGDLLSAGSTTEAWVPQAREGARSATTFAHTSDAITESRSYYSADGMLRVHQVNRAKRDGLQTTPHLDTLDGVYEVYWYDALGRRVLKRSIQEDGELCNMRHVLCHDTIERFVWDGSQVLAEVRATDASNAAAGGPAGPQTGRIVYVHPGGVDAPAGMVRNGVPYALHANWRGLYAFATDSLGRKAEESTVERPANNRRAFLGRANTQEWSWFGSLVSSGTDASGLLYRRNRYYDPQSGQFTQQDPIGIAGGLNLYGFAGGDPVNNADPFGLCPWMAGDTITVVVTVTCPDGTNERRALQAVRVGAEELEAVRGVVSTLEGGSGSVTPDAVRSAYQRVLDKGEIYVFSSRAPRGEPVETGGQTQSWPRWMFWTTPRVLLRADILANLGRPIAYTVVGHEGAHLVNRALGLKLSHQDIYEILWRRR